MLRFRSSIYGVLIASLFFSCKSFKRDKQTDTVKRDSVTTIVTSERASIQDLTTIISSSDNFEIIRYEPQQVKDTIIFTPITVRRATNRVESNTNTIEQKKADTRQETKQNEEIDKSTVVTEHENYNFFQSILGAIFGKGKKWVMIFGIFVAFLVYRLIKKVWISSDQSFRR